MIKAPPSSLSKPEVFILQVQPKVKIQCGHPCGSEYFTQPVTLYCKVFCQFLKDCDDKTANIPKVIRENVINICQAMPQYYKNETECGDMFKPVLFRSQYNQ